MAAERLVVRFRARVWVWDGSAAWHFVTLPKGLSASLKRLFGGARPGFGSLKVEARIGATAWSSSVFPDAKRGAYVLPLKAAVRKAEGLLPGRTVAVELGLRP